MKLAYFDQDSADPDDTALAAAVARGVVPSGCLLGGTVVMDFNRMGFTPCSVCSGPRDRCGGEAFDNVASSRLEDRLSRAKESTRPRLALVDDEAEAWRAQRAQWIEGILSGTRDEL